MDSMNQVNYVKRTIAEMVCVLTLCGLSFFFIYMFATASAKLRVLELKSLTLEVEVLRLHKEAVELGYAKYTGTNITNWTWITNK